VRRTLSGAERLAPTRAPLLGEHNDEVLAGVLGLSDGEIGRLHDEGSVRTHPEIRVHVRIDEHRSE
jgi:crotonobetainyl-CoA:carnitine CoA-transferase CaiB-like acyl-CoA transferase